MRHGGAAYGIFLDNTYRTNFDFGKESRDFYSFGADGGELDYYFFYGPDPKRVIQDFTTLVGRSPLPPLPRPGFAKLPVSSENARFRPMSFISTSIISRTIVLSPLIANGSPTLKGW